MTVPLGYDPAIPRAHYDRVADDEWTRLTRSRRGELNFLVHMDVLRRHVTADMDVLEIGAGSGIYTKELAHMTRRLVVSDISEVQLALNRDHMRELGVVDRVDEYRVLDLLDLNALEAESFDAVVCVGGPLSYLLDKESVGVSQILRVVRPGGIVVLGVMSLINTLVLFMGMVPAETRKSYRSSSSPRSRFASAMAGGYVESAASAASMCRIASPWFCMNLRYPR